MRSAKHSNKCCENPKNKIMIKPGWSEICTICGRFNFDYRENQYILSKIELIDKLKEVIFKKNIH